LIGKANLRATQYQIIPDEPGDRDQLLPHRSADNYMDFIPTAGNAGIIPRDSAHPVIRQRLSNQS